MSSVQRLTAISLIAFFSLGAYAFNVSTTSMDMGMAMDGQTHSFCPMAGMTSACTNVLDHISYWQLALTSTLAEIVELLALAFVLVRFGYWLSARFAPSPPLRPQRISDAPTLFQRLFSAGILNPKLF